MTRIATVLVLDAEQRSALAATRSLGQAGARVHVASCKADSLAGASRWATAGLHTPDPAVDVAAYVQCIHDHAATENVDFILPMTDASTMALLAAKDWPQGCQLLCPPPAAYEQVTDKARLLQLAAQLGVPAPRPVMATDVHGISAAADQLGYPLILKPARSRYSHAGHIASTGVRVVQDQNQLQALLPQLDWLPHMPCLVQEFIAGHGAGVFALYGRSGPLAWFAHRRLREKPPAGGVSVLSESANVDPLLQHYAQLLLDAAQWRGPAMVEYRISTDGKPYLMEINGRYWGSLQLAVDAGVDFPSLWLREGQGEAALPLPAVKAGTRLRWLLGDVDNLIIQWRSSAGVARKLSAFAAFLLTFIDSRSRQEIFRWSDRRPAWLELRAWLASLRQ